MKKCKNCDKKAGHESWSPITGKTTNLCCYHWVKKGNSPASWHYDCMEAHKREQNDKRPVD